MPPESVARWVAHRAKQLGLEMEAEAIAALVESASTGWGALAQELDTLAAVAAGRAATRDDVAALGGGRRGPTKDQPGDAAREARAADARGPVTPVRGQA